MHVHPPGGGTVLLVTNKICFVTDHKGAPVFIGYIGEIVLSTFLHSSWERECVNMIFQPDLAMDKY